MVSEKGRCYEMCNLPRGETQAGRTTIVLERGQTTLVYKNVPAEVCDNCGEEYLSVEINWKLLKQAEQAAERGVDLEMLRYAA